MYDVAGVQRIKRLPLFQFFFRYPIFLLTLGPPLFRHSAGIDVTKGIIDFWAYFQVAWISLFSLRAILRLITAKSIYIPKQIRSILNLAFFLGILYMVSAAYSTDRFVSAAYATFYILAWICVAEFIIDVYRNPPDWIQCLFQLRTICLFLFALVVIAVPYEPDFVMSVSARFFRLTGGAVAPIMFVCPIITIISAYALLYSLEPKTRSIVFFIAGLAGTLITHTRSSEIALLLSLAILFITRAMTGRRTAYLFTSGFIFSIFFTCILVGVIGAGRIWNYFNRSQELTSIESVSGRTYIWNFVINYCMAHPQGMGYVAGFRTIFRNYYGIGLPLDVTHIGTSHNSFIQVLADAGWLALAIYLVMIAMIVFLGWRFAKASPIVVRESYSIPHHAMTCALILFFFCLVAGITASDFDIPLRAAFYIQNLIIAFILGISSNMISISAPIAPARFPAS